MKKILLLSFLILNYISYAQILTESFEGEIFPPAGWSETIVEHGYGIAPQWYRFEGTDLDNYNPGLGSPAQDGSFTAVFNSGASMWTGRLESPLLDFSTYSTINLSYQMFHDPMASWEIFEFIQIQVSVDGGEWQNIGEQNKRQIFETNTTYWKEAVLSLNNFAGSSNVKIGFLADGDQGENMHIDNLVITGEQDSTIPEITDIIGLGVALTSDMKIKMNVSDQNMVKSTLNAVYSFDNFTTSESFQFSLKEELPAGDILRNFSFEGTIPASESPANGKLKVELVDQFGNGTGIWSDDFFISWYSPVANISEGFENCDDFSFVINGWNNIDEDKLNTWNVGGGYPNWGKPGAFQIFNPAAAEPAMNEGYNANTGEKGAVCFQAVSGTNDDWLISKAIIPGDDLQISLWAKEIYCALDEYSKFEIAVSTTDIYPESFTVISEETVTTSNWQNYTFPISGYEDNDYLYIAIHNISDGATSTGLYLDDLEINRGLIDNQQPELEEFKGNKVATGSEMKIWTYVKDRSEIAQSFNGKFSFDDFSTSDDVSFTLKQELAGDLFNHYIYEGTIPAQTVAVEGKIKFELIDQFGNGSGNWTEAIDIKWYEASLPFSDSFENYEDFSLEFGNWTNLDLDKAITWGPSTGAYPNQTSPKSFMIFNPLAATPAMTEAWHQPYTGEKAALCSKSTSNNNDWLISPALLTAEDMTLNFWAKTIDGSYDMEEFRVCISTTGVFPEDFETEINGHYVEGQDYINAPENWTEFSFDLSKYAANEYIYVGIQCISKYITLNGLLIDDFTVAGTPSDIINNLPKTTKLYQNYPNPFNPSTTINFYNETTGKITLTVFNAKGELIQNLINREFSAGKHNINFEAKNLNSGVYYYTLQTEKKSITKKMILIK